MRAPWPPSIILIHETRFDTLLLLLLLFCRSDSTSCNKNEKVSFQIYLTVVERRTQSCFCGWTCVFGQYYSVGLAA